jgi:hypothetical protein
MMQFVQSFLFPLTRFTPLQLDLQFNPDAGKKYIIQNKQVPSTYIYNSTCNKTVSFSTNKDIVNESLIDQKCIPSLDDSSDKMTLLTPNKDIVEDHEANNHLLTEQECNIFGQPDASSNIFGQPDASSNKTAILTPNKDIVEDHEANNHLLTEQECNIFSQPDASSNKTAILTPNKDSCQPYNSNSGTYINENLIIVDQTPNKDICEPYEANKIVTFKKKSLIEQEQEYYIVDDTCVFKKYLLVSVPKQALVLTQLKNDSYICPLALFKSYDALYKLLTITHKTPPINVSSVTNNDAKYFIRLFDPGYLLYTLIKKILLYKQVIIPTTQIYSRLPRVKIKYSDI